MKNTQKGKNIIKGATQESGHSIKLHFWMPKRSQVKDNVLDCQNLFEIFFIKCKDYMLKAWYKSKMFLHVQNIQTSRIDNLYFSNVFFLLPNVHHSFLKLERILTLMIRREKRFELMKMIFITDLNTFGSKVLLILKSMDFKHVPLTKFVHVYVIEGMNAWYTWYKICSQNVFISKM